MQKHTRIIIVDDHRLIRKALKNIFEQTEDMEVVAEARNAEEVFREIDNHSADVMVLDLNLPGTDGLEILQQLKRSKKNLPVVILTLYSQDASRKKAIALGAVDFLSKDCDPHDLVEAIRRATERAA
jgi:DNA-binding NarL/FixJ family response regulator